MEQIASTYGSTGSEIRLFHDTDNDGLKAIGSQPVSLFKSEDPPGDHPHGAYFTTLDPATVNLAARLRIPKAKVAFVFCFSDGSVLKPLRGGRGAFVFYSPCDYAVEKERQIDHGPTHEVLERLS